MRDKLIEILYNGFHVSPKDDLNGVVQKVADYLIANGVTVRQMIPVTEHQPEKPGEYLVWKCQKHPHFAIDTYTEFGWYGGQYVMSWIPLPAAPKEVE